MASSKVVGRRLPLSLLALLAWFGLSSAAFAVSTSSWVDAVITGLLGIAAIGIAINGRVIDSAERKPINSASVIFLLLVLGAVVLFEIFNLRTWDLVLLGQVRVQSVIRTVKSIGSIAISFWVLWELIRIMRSNPEPM